MVELAYEPLSAWSLNVPTFQNISAHLPTDLSKFWGGGKGEMKGTSSEAERKW